MLFKSSVIISLALLLSSCDLTTKIDTMNQQLDRVEKNGKALMIKMVTLEHQIQSMKNGPSKSPKKVPANPNKVYKVPVGSSYVHGKKDAPVTIVKWLDYQCPYCAQSVKLVDDILKKYPNDVKVVYKNFPLSFHKQAKMAAKYSLAAEKQGKYIEMYHAIYKDYKKLRENPELPVEIAKNLGLDLEKFKKDYADPSIEKQIEKEMFELKNTGVARLSVPKFFINGKEPKGRDITLWSQMIDSEIAKAAGSGKKAL